MDLKAIAKLIDGASVHESFDYGTDEKRHFNVVLTEKEPTTDNLRLLLDHKMQVKLSLFASKERGQYRVFEINYQNRDDYEWV